MTPHTARTRAWLDRNFDRAVAERFRHGYTRLYRPDGGLGPMPVGHVIVLARTYTILRALGRLSFSSCLDVGAGSGRLAHLIERLFGAACSGVDLSSAFAAAARRDFGLPTYVANAAALPFADGAFDLVISSEVLEHVEDPLAVMAELWRVARHAVVITTQEACRGAWQRRAQMAAAERDQPHAERNYFLPADFRTIFGPATELRATLHLPERIRLFPRKDVAELERCVRALAVEREFGAGAFGVLVAALARIWAQPPLPGRALRATLRTALRIADVLASPLSWRDKGRLVWRFLTEP
jgi:ubiquinone/menaquinone biosynthesis C-methylase UbiE